MRTPLVYLAHPIDLVEDISYPRVLSERCSAAAYRHGAVTYRPFQAFHLPDTVQPDTYIAQVNDAALSASHGLIALLPEWPTIGVGLEIQKAQQQRIPTLIMVTESVASRSWSLPGLESVQMLAVPDELADWDTFWKSTLNQAVKQLIESARSKQTVDSVRAHARDPLRVVLDDDGCWVPTRAYPGDAGFDLYCRDGMAIPPNTFVDIPCGLSVELPVGVWGFITGRSSTLRKYDLMVNPGIIDQGYRGPLYVGVKNLGDQPFQVKRGMRLAQLIPMPLTADTMVPIRTDKLHQSERGSSGFGSSGE